MKTVAFHNLGCKVNSYETDYLTQEMTARGFLVVPFSKRADVYIINTCSVTNIADRKSRQMLHRAKKENPEAVIAATGCYVQGQSREVLREVGVDIAVGNNHKAELPDLIVSFLAQQEGGQPECICRIDDIAAEKECEKMLLLSQTEHTRAYVKIQDGCNQFCTYCIIPYMRGRIRSRAEEEILTEIARLTERGYHEFILTGIHLSSYGAPQNAGVMQLSGGPLLALIRKIDALPGVRRIRLGSLEPRIVTEEFARELSSVPSVCPHFHLSLQSGCAETLRRMNRHYTPLEYLEGVRVLRKYFADPAITTDVIVAFPGETEAEFAASKAFLSEVNFFEMHIFRYSRRKGTLADRMDGQVPSDISERRSDELLEMERRMSLAYREQWIGREVEILVEEEKEIDGQRYWVGHTPQYVLAAVSSRKDLRGAFVRAEGVRMLTEEIVFCLEIKEDLG